MAVLRASEFSDPVSLFAALPPMQSGQACLTVDGLKRFWGLSPQKIKKGM
jgi:hypothetical protein